MTQPSRECRAAADVDLLPWADPYIASLFREQHAAGHERRADECQPGPLGDTIAPLASPARSPATRVLAPLFRRLFRSARVSRPRRTRRPTASGQVS
jgi:hypothetical protein